MRTFKTYKNADGSTSTLVNELTTNQINQLIEDIKEFGFSNLLNIYIENLKKYRIGSPMYNETYLRVNWLENQLKNLIINN